MTNFLYRWGLRSARRPLLTIMVWVLVLAIGGASAIFLARGATSNYTIPGASFQKVSDELKARLPEAGASSGLITLSTQDGQAFTQTEKDAFTQTLNQVKQLPAVASVSNPFDAQAQLDQSAQDIQNGPNKIADGQKQIDDGFAKLAEGEKQLADAQKQVDDGRTQLDAAKAQLPAGISGEQLAQLAPDLVAQQTQLDQTQTQLDTTRSQLNQTRTQLEQSQTDLNSQKTSLEQGQKALNLAGSTRFVNEENTVALVNIAFTEDIYSLSKTKRQEILDRFDSLNSQGLKVTYSNEIVQDVSGMAGSSEALGLIVALFVLVVTLSSVIAAGLPVIVALLGCGIGVSIVYASTAVFAMTSTDPVLALMLGLGVGIDYALLILYRFREYLVEGKSRVEAAGLANSTAGHSVLFAGLTNIIALSALTVTGVPFLGVMGLAGAFTVGVVVLVALTATPAILALVGEKTLSKAQKKALADGVTLEESRSQKLERGNRGWGAFVTRHPLIMVLLSLAVLGTAMIPTSSLRLGLPDGSYQQTESTAYQTYKIISDNFGEGRNAMIFAMVETPNATSETESRAKALEVASQLKISSIQAATVGTISQDFHTALITLTPAQGPNAPETASTVHQLTDKLSEVEKSTDTTIGLTGQAVANIDISDSILQAVPVYLGVVLALCLVLMTFVFKSLLIPFMATIGFLMSTLASFGAVVAVYQWGWLSSIFDVANPGAILAFLPILLVGILFGLSVDYQIFIVSGMRDAYQEGFSAREAVRVGYRQGGAVVTACGIIMISVFAGFIYSHLTVVRPIGFALALGVAMDAFLVRTTFIPAAMYLLGEKAWWLPKPLAKVLGTVRQPKK